MSIATWVFFRLQYVSPEGHMQPFWSKHADAKPLMTLRGEISAIDTTALAVALQVFQSSTGPTKPTKSRCFLLICDTCSVVQVSCSVATTCTPLGHALLVGVLSHQEKQPGVFETIRARTFARETAEKHVVQRVRTRGSTASSSSSPALLCSLLRGPSGMPWKPWELTDTSPLVFRSP